MNNNETPESKREPHITLEEVVREIDSLPKFAQKPVKEAYLALKDIHGMFLCMKDCGYYNQTMAYCANSTSKGLGTGRRIVVNIVEKKRPITYCECEVLPLHCDIEDKFTALLKKSPGTEVNGVYDFYSLKEIDKHIPETIEFKNVKFNLCRTERIGLDRRQYIYFEAFE